MTSTARARSERGGHAAARVRADPVDAGEPDEAEPISLLSDAALVFYGMTMLVAAVRSHAGCGVLAISTWMLRRDDQVGCLLSAPIDAVERPAISSG